MTQEEKLELLKKSGITVLGDLVLEKHVENQSRNTEPPPPGILHQHGGSNGGRPKGGDSPKLVNTTFQYKYFDDRSEQIRIVRFYQQLLKGKLIAEDTMPESFCNIFSGKECECKVKWIEKPSYLYYLINELEKRKLITFDGDKWIITQSHFVDSKSKMFEGFNKLHDPKKAVRALNKLADILDPSVPQDEE